MALSALRLKKMVFMSLSPEKRAALASFSLVTNSTRNERLRVIKVSWNLFHN